MDKFIETLYAATPEKDRLQEIRDTIMNNLKTSGVSNETMAAAISRYYPKVDIMSLAKPCGALREQAAGGRRMLLEAMELCETEGGEAPFEKLDALVEDLNPTEKTERLLQIYRELLSWNDFSMSTELDSRLREKHPELLKQHIVLLAKAEGQIVVDRMLSALAEQPMGDAGDDERFTQEENDWIEATAQCAAQGFDLQAAGLAAAGHDIVLGRSFAMMMKKAVQSGLVALTNTVKKLLSTTVVVLIDFTAKSVSRIMEKDRPERLTISFGWPLVMMGAWGSAKVWPRLTIPFGWLPAAMGVWGSGKAFSDMGGRMTVVLGDSKGKTILESFTAYLNRVELATQMPVTSQIQDRNDMRHINQNV